MTGRIVVGIDGSSESAGALEWAVGRAAVGGQALELVNAYTMPADIYFYGYQGTAAAQPVDWFREYSQELLAAAAGRVAEMAPDITCSLTSEMGTPAFVLGTASEGADLVVVGRRGLGAAASAVLGSVSNRLTVGARCPLVVVGHGEQPAGGPVVVGVDGSDFGTHALRHALGEAAARGTSVRAVTAFQVSDQAVQGDPELVARIRAGVEGDAADIIAKALADARTPETESVTVDGVAVEGRAADAILAHADDAQLIVVGSHGKGLVRRVLLGSVSRQVL